MIRVRNATQFVGLLRATLNDYEEQYRERVAVIRAHFTNTPIPPDVDDALEAHKRVYFINRVLEALNWRVLDRSDELFLVPEVPLRSLQEHTIRFLDYLGVEKEGTNPLLLVETKRPRVKLPIPVLVSETDMPLPYHMHIAAGLHGMNLGAEWNGYLSTLRDYVRSVKDQVGFAPRRVVSTNGDWLILFRNPADAFLPEGQCDPDNICVYGNGQAMVERANELFGLLECYTVREDVSIRAIESAGQLLFHVGAEDIDRVMHGLRLEYIERVGMYDSERPEICVAPLLFIHAQNGDWFRFEKRAITSVYRIPPSASSLPEHLEAVKTSAEELLQEVNSVVGRALTPISLAEHYANREAFVTLPGVKEDTIVSENRRREYIVLTGTSTHFLLPKPSVEDCPHHFCERSQEQGVAVNNPIREQGTTQPRCFFPSGQLHHCAHRDVFGIKTSPITPLNREQCGSRSGRNDEAFCEIAPFEEYLCCRTCAFEEVCTKAPVFYLPCKRQSGGKNM